MSQQTDTMITEKRLTDVLNRARSLNSMIVDEALKFDEGSIDPFEEDSRAVTRKDSPNSSTWFEDPHDSDKMQDPFGDPNGKVHYDCFGYSLFELEADSQFPAVKPTRVKTVPTAAAMPEADEKAARRARRRRSSARVQPEKRPMRRRASIGGGGTNANPVTTEAVLAASLPKDTSDSRRLRRSRSNGRIGIETSPQELLPMIPSKSSESKMRRSKSGLGLGPQNHGKSRRRHSLRHSTGDRRHELALLLALDNSQGNIQSPEMEAPKVRRRSSSRLALRKTISDPAKKNSLKSSSEHQDNKERRRYRRMDM